ETLLTSTGVGECFASPISRRGQKPGDLLCAIGHFGNGPALGIRYLLQQKTRLFPEKLFRPQARLKARLKLRPLLTSSMDTSDGLASTLVNLSAINGLCYDLYITRDLFTPESLRLCDKMQVSYLSLFFAEHGDYQLVVTLPAEKLPVARR